MRKEVLSVCPETLFRQIKRSVCPMLYSDGGKIKKYKTRWNRAGKYDMSRCVLWPQMTHCNNYYDTFDLVIHKQNVDLCDFSFKTTMGKGSGGGRYDGVIFTDDNSIIVRNKIYWIILQLMVDHKFRAIDVGKQCINHLSMSLPAGLTAAKVREYIEYIDAIKVGKMCITCHSIIKYSGTGNKKYCNVKCRNKAVEMRANGHNCAEWGGIVNYDHFG